MEEDLLREGWSLSEKGLEYCKTICANKNPSKKDIITNALHTDIREIGKQRLPADINKQHSSEILGPVVLQILKVKNVSAPNAKEDSSFAPRMLKLTMTDGVVTCSGIEMEMIKAISLSTSPGSKVCLLGNLTVQHGFVLLDSMNLKFLGGEVDHLRAKWEISKNVSKLQRKVLTADGGPPLFVPFEDSDFAKRKPQGPSVTIKHVEASAKQKGKPTHKTEISSKAFENKKIWKSEPLSNKKGRNSSSAKAGYEAKEKPGGNSQQPKPEANGRQKYESNRLANGKSFDDGEQNRSASRYGSKKDTVSRDDRKIDEKGKERKFGEEKRPSSASSKDFRNVKSDGSERKDGANSGKPRVGEASDSRGQKQQDHFLKDRYEKPSRKSGKYEQPISEKNSLPPRLEKLKQSSYEQEYNKLECKEQEYGKGFSKKTGENRGRNSNKPAVTRNENPTDDAIEKVRDMTIGEMKREDKHKEIRNSDKRNYTRSSSAKDFNYRKKDYDVNHAREDRQHDGKVYNEKRERFGTEAADRDRRYQDDRSNGKRDGYVDRERGYGRNRTGKGQERYYNGGERRRSAGQEIDGRKWENGVETGHQGHSNDLDRNQRCYGEMTLEGASNKQVDTAPMDATTKEQMNYSFPSSGNDMSKRIESETSMMQGREQPDKVKEFMNSVIQNTLQAGDFQLMHQQGSSDLNLSQTRMQQQPPPQLPQQQPMVNSSGHVAYDYYPPYPTVVYPTGISQGYPTMPSQNFQPGGYQPPIHQLQPMSQYQGFNVPSTVQDYQYVQAIAPQMNYQNPRMPRSGQQQRVRPRIRHDVFRPKRN